MEVEGVYQCYCIGTNYSQEFLHTLVHLSNLGVCQNTRLGKKQTDQSTRLSQQYASHKNLPPSEHKLAFLHPKIQWFSRCKIPPHPSAQWSKWQFVTGYKHEQMPSTVTIYHPSLLLVENKENLVRAFHQNSTANGLIKVNNQNLRPKHLYSSAFETSLWTRTLALET